MGPKKSKKKVIDVTFFEDNNPSAQQQEQAIQSSAEPSSIPETLQSKSPIQQPKQQHPDLSVPHPHQISQTTEPTPSKQAEISQQVNKFAVTKKQVGALDTQQIPERVIVKKKKVVEQKPVKKVVKKKKIVVGAEMFNDFDPQIQNPITLDVKEESESKQQKELIELKEKSKKEEQKSEIKQQKTDEQKYKQAILINNSKQIETHQQQNISEEKIINSVDNIQSAEQLKNVHQKEYQKQVNAQEELNNVEAKQQIEQKEITQYPPVQEVQQKSPQMRQIEQQITEQQTKPEQEINPIDVTPLQPSNQNIESNEQYHQNTLDEQPLRINIAEVQQKQQQYPIEKQKSQQRQNIISHPQPQQLIQTKRQSKEKPILQQQEHQYPEQSKQIMIQTKQQQMVISQNNTPKNEEEVKNIEVQQQPIETINQNVYQQKQQSVLQVKQIPKPELKQKQKEGEKQKKVPVKKKKDTTTTVKKSAPSKKIMQLNVETIDINTTLQDITSQVPRAHQQQQILLNKLQQQKQLQLQRYRQDEKLNQLIEDYHKGRLQQKIKHEAQVPEQKQKSKEQSKHFRSIQSNNSYFEEQNNTKTQQVIQTLPTQQLPPISFPQNALPSLEQNKVDVSQPIVVQETPASEFITIDLNSAIQPKPKALNKNPKTSKTVTKKPAKKKTDINIANVQIEESSETTTMKFEQNKEQPDVIAIVPEKTLIVSETQKKQIEKQEIIATPEQIIVPKEQIKKQVEKQEETIQVDKSSNKQEQPLNEEKNNQQQFFEAKQSPFQIPIKEQTKKQSEEIQPQLLDITSKVVEPQIIQFDMAPKKKKTAKTEIKQSKKSTKTTTKPKKTSTITPQSLVVVQSFSNANNVAASSTDLIKKQQQKPSSTPSEIIIQTKYQEQQETQEQSLNKLSDNSSTLNIKNNIPDAFNYTQHYQQQISYNHPAQPRRHHNISNTLLSKVSVKQLKQDAKTILRQTTIMLKEDLLSRALQKSYNNLPNKKQQQQQLSQDDLIQPAIKSKVAKFSYNF